MSMNLMFQSANPRDDAAAWSSIKALGDESGRVAVEDATVVAAAALLANAPLANGETVTTYDFSGTDGETGASWTDAHVETFGPSLLTPETLSALRELLRPHGGALAMLDHIVAERLQVSMSTSDLGGRAMPHLKGVNWEADEVEIKGSGGLIHEVLGRLGIPSGGSSTGEIAFDRFAAAVDAHGVRLGDMLGHMRRFVDCARRNQTATVYWA